MIHKLSTYKIEHMKIEIVMIPFNIITHVQHTWLPSLLNCIIFLLDECVVFAWDYKNVLMIPNWIKFEQEKQMSRGTTRTRQNLFLLLFTGG